jgi:Na+-driven multidrug efflux pump
VAYLLAFFTPLSYHAVWVSVPISWGYSLILSSVRYRRGKWLGKAIVPQKKTPQESE